MTKLNHGRTGRGLALIVFAVPSSSTVPGIGAFDHPTLPPGRKTGAPLGACLDFETPRGTMDGHPGVQIVIMVFIVPKDRLEVWEGCGRDQGEQLRGRLAIIKPSPVIHTAMSKPKVSTRRGRLRPFTFLPPS